LPSPAVVDGFFYTTVPSLLVAPMLFFFSLIFSATADLYLASSFSFIFLWIIISDVLMNDLLNN